MTQPIKLRWVLAHVPYDLFLRSADIFAKKVYEKSNGQIEIEIMGADEYVKQYAPGQQIEGIQFASLVNDGVVEMSQMYNTTLSYYNDALSVLELPFMFRDHDHATKVLDGEVGMGMLGDLAKKSNIRGLAFTYSGGFRMIVGNEPITSVDDIKGQRVRTSSTEVAQKTFSEIGAIPVNVPIYKMKEAMIDDVVDIGENTWARYFRTGLNEVSTHVSNTKHSLFLTAIIINEQTWQSLSEEMQQCMKEAALEAAQSERLESLEDGELAIERCAKDGIKVIEWNEEETNRYKELVKPVYDYFEQRLPKGLIESVKNIH
jgi:TRAP-type C4-dicarboxylate transport system substrate-binding protein